MVKALASSLNRNVNIESEEIRIELQKRERCASP